MSAIESDSDKGADTNAQRHLHRTGRTINTNSTMFNRVRHSILKWSKVKRDVLRADVRFFRMRHRRTLSPSEHRLLEYIVTITTHFVSTAPITSQNVRGNKATLLFGCTATRCHLEALQPVPSITVDQKTRSRFLHSLSPGRCFERTFSNSLFVGIQARISCKLAGI